MKFKKTLKMHCGMFSYSETILKEEGDRSSNGISFKYNKELESTQIQQTFQMMETLIQLRQFGKKKSLSALMICSK